VVRSGGGWSAAACAATCPGRRGQVAALLGEHEVDDTAFEGMLAIDLTSVNQEAQLQASGAGEHDMEILAAVTESAANGGVGVTGSGADS